MCSLNTDFSEDEKKVLEKCTGNQFYILSNVENECYILCEDGNYKYNECFEHTNSEYFKNQKYEKANPYRMIRFYEYYLMERHEESNVWYRGRKNANKNYEFDCCCDDLEEVFDSL